MVLAVLDGEPIALAGCPGRGCPSNEEARAAATARPSNVTGGGGRPLRPGGASLGARRRSAKAALDCCPSYSGGRLRRLPGACGCAEYCSRVFLTRRRNIRKTRFSKRILSRAEP